MFMYVPACLHNQSCFYQGHAFCCAHVGCLVSLSEVSCLVDILHEETKYLPGELFVEEDQ